MSESPSTVVLRALEGSPMRDPQVRRIVESMAHAIAERNGVHLVELRVADDHVLATLEVNRLAALGFAAELRRLTTAWHRAREPDAPPLWGDPRSEPPEEEDEADWWKR